MRDETPLDQAHARMQADLDDDAARARFYARLADDELFVLLSEEAKDNNISPDLFELDGARYVLVFDREERLAEFSGRPAPYAALPGRVIAQMLAGQDIGLGVNLGVAPSSILVPGAALDWLAETLQQDPEQVEARIRTLFAPDDLPEDLIAGLAAKLTNAAGLASYAALAGVTYADGRRGHLIGIVDPRPGAQPALARAVNEALTFSGLDDAHLDVGFFAAEDPIARKLAANGLRFDLKAPDPAQPEKPAGPGMDPDRPPILK